MSQARSKKKSPAQLDREIAEVLHRGSRTARHSPKTTRPMRGHATAKKPPKRVHATAKKDGKANGKQEGLLLVANDAALSLQFDRVEGLLKQGPARAIATAFQVVDEESSRTGDSKDSGWEDEEGDAIEVSSYDIEEQVEAESATPVTDAFVKQAVQWLRDHGANEASSSSYHKGVWYSSPSEMDYSSGEERSEDFFLRNFTEDEERRVFKEFHGGRRQ